MATNNSVSKLRTMLQAAKEEKKMSNRKIAEVATQRGYRLTHGTVSNVILGRFERPAEDTLKGLSAALEIPYDDLLEAANYAPRLGEYKPPRGSERLTMEQRRAVDRIITLFVEDNDMLMTDD